MTIHCLNFVPGARRHGEFGIQTESHPVAHSMRQNVPRGEKFVNAPRFALPLKREGRYRRGNTFSEIIPIYASRNLKNTSAGKNNALLSDPAQLLEAWSDHFHTLAESQIISEPEMKEAQRQQVSLLSSTSQMEETYLDTTLPEDEVADAVRKMKLRKSAGPDDLVAEHLRYGGRSVIIWLTEILNSILDIE